MSVIDHGPLHAMILRHIIDHGFAPEVAAIAERFACSAGEAEASLHALQDYHGVVLHPDRPKVWAIHPFSLAPTLFTVRSARGLWWGNCAWCSLGVAALLEEDATITTTLGGHDQQVIVRIRDGRIDRTDLHVHFPIRMTEAWDNVVYTCSNMLLFRDTDEVDAWCCRHDIPRGDLQPIERIWEFSKVWYGNHLDPEWKKWTLQEAKGIFRKFALTSDTWALEATGERF